MKLISRKILIVLLLLFALFTAKSISAFSNGILASDIVGQYDGTSYTDPVGIFTKGGANDGPNIFGFNSPRDGLFDEINHRFFLIDSGNNRVLVYNLNTDNTFPDKFPDYVLGQPDFYTNTAKTTQDGMNSPQGLAYDSISNRLFVSQSGSPRVTVYDVSSITNGEPAINVLGQVDFASSVASITQSGLNNPTSILCDPIRNYLFVSQGDANRVTVFDVSEITDGENAINVIGQADFTSNIGVQNQVNLYKPRGLAYDTDRQYLFVGQQSGRRITVYDLSDGITNGENAINVLGQVNFTANISTVSQVGTNPAWGLEYDNINDRLFVSNDQATANRILVYNLADGITDGEPAVNVLGQNVFTAATSTTTQASLIQPLFSTYDSVNNKLLVSDSANNRIMFFDVAEITNGENAVDMMGQYDGTSYTNPVPTYTKGGANNGPNFFGINAPQDLFMDKIEHRLFIVEVGNSRVLVYNLNENNILVDKIPDYVLGKPDFHTMPNATISDVNLNAPRGIAYDYENKKLFVSESNNHRILVYDLADGITNGEPAVNVLGQPDFTHNNQAISATGLSYPYGLYYDSDSERIFVADRTNNRVLVYDLSDGITNGEPAVSVLGQSDFTHNTVGTTQTGMSSPRGVLTVDDKLFVLEYSNNRVLVYDLSDGITNGEPAINVLGQADFTSGGPSTSATGLYYAMGIAYDPNTKNFFVADGVNNRVVVYNLSDGIVNGEPAISVLGQTNFTQNTAKATQDGMTNPLGLFFDSDNKFLYVNEYSGHRVTVYNLSDTTITSVSAPSDSYKQGDTIPISVTFSKVVNVTGTPTLTLETGETDQTVEYVSGTGSNTLIFNYEVKKGDINPDLDVTDTNALSLNGGTILDLYNSIPIITLPSPGSANSLSNTSDVNVYIKKSTGSMMRIQLKAPAVLPPINPINPLTPLDTNTITTPTTPKTEIFTKNLFPKNKGENVLKLQNLLKELGYFKVKPTGFYGNITKQAVKQYQKDHNIPQTGNVGPLTRKALGGIK